MICLRSPRAAGGAVFVAVYWQDLSILSPGAEGCHHPCADAAGDVAGKRAGDQ